MVLKIFTKEDGPETRKALETGARIAQEGFEVVYFDALEKNSEQLLEIHDIYNFPTFVVTRDDGSEVESWKGIVPLESDVKMFLNS